MKSWGILIPGYQKGGQHHVVHSRLEVDVDTPGYIQSSCQCPNSRAQVIYSGCYLDDLVCRPKL